jgi:hypothetical protein
MPNESSVTRSTHTAGRWGAVYSHADGRQHIFSEDGPVAHVLAREDVDEQNANAYLISSAPVLLQLVREGLQAFESRYDAAPNIDIRDWMKEARTVIAFIEGRPL